MPNYRYVGPYDRFFPDVRDANGQSLDAKAGMVVSWAVPPNPAEWVETEEPVTWVVDRGVPAAPQPTPEPVQETFPDEPKPETPVAVPEAPQEPTGPSELEPVPEPAPEPEPVQPALTADWFSALGNPPARA